MPYEYRKMTLQEREAILRERRLRGYPFHSPPHPFRQGYRYLLTAVNFDHTPIMASPERRTEFAARLLSVMRDIGAEVHGWAVLPNHYHASVAVQSLDIVPGALKRLHGTTSREWNLEDGQSGKRKVWYKFTDRVIRDDRGFYQALNYIHFNPLKHGYVTDVYHWQWSSIHDYCEAYGPEWLRKKWKAQPIGDFGKGWDD